MPTLLKRGVMADSKFSVPSPCEKNHSFLSLQCPQDGAELVRSALLNDANAKEDAEFVRCDADGPLLTIICTTKSSLARTQALASSLIHSILNKPLARYYIKGVGGLGRRQLVQLMSRYGRVTGTFMFDNHRKSSSYGSTAIVSILLSSPPEETIQYSSGGRTRFLRLSIAKPRKDAEVEEVKAVEARAEDAKAKALTRSAASIVRFLVRRRLAHSWTALHEGPKLVPPGLEPVAQPAHPAGSDPDSVPDRPFLPVLLAQEDRKVPSAPLPASDTGVATLPVTDTLPEVATRALSAPRAEVVSAVSPDPFSGSSFVSISDRQLRHDDPEDEGGFSDSSPTFSATTSPPAKKPHEDLRPLSPSFAATVARSLGNGMGSLSSAFKRSRDARSPPGRGHASPPANLEGVGARRWQAVEATLVVRACLILPVIPQLLAPLSCNYD